MAAGTTIPIELSRLAKGPLTFALHGMSEAHLVKRYPVVLNRGMTVQDEENTPLTQEIE